MYKKDIVLITQLNIQAIKFSVTYFFRQLSRRIVPVISLASYALI
jgi:hypothetical protein